MPQGEFPASETPTPQGFVATHWTVVMAAVKGGSAESASALERLCTTYWWPLYAFVRREGKTHHDAQDLVQGFFQQMLARDSFSAVDRTKGKFRTYLLACMKHFLAKDYQKNHTQKRGGNCVPISIDIESAAEPYQQIASTSKTPDQVFDQQWATTLLNQTLGRLRDEFIASGKGTLFEDVKIFLTGEKQSASYAELAVKLGTTEAALKMTVSRMRQRYGELLREEIANTVSCPEEIDGEVRALFAALSS